MENNVDLDIIQKQILSGKICPYCLNKSNYVDSIIIYKVRSYGMIYHCPDCDAYCGVHKGTDIALGRLANRQLRELKKEAHKYFDMLWKDVKIISRSDAYKWLSEQLEIHPDLTHIGMFDERQCKEVVDVSKMMLNDNRRLDLDFGLPEPTPYFH